MSESPRIAIVGMGGLFPSAPTPEQLWENVRTCLDASREPPDGRWWLPPQQIWSRGERQLDRVPSLRACFLDPFTVNLDELELESGLLDQLDPVFHLAVETCRRAWQSAVTQTLDRNRVGVVLGSIALPTDKTSQLARHVLGRRFFAQAGRSCPFTDEMPHPLNAQVTGLPAILAAKALGLGGLAFTLDAACASSLYAIKLASDELVAGRADAMLAGGLSRPDSLYVQMGFTQLHALSPTGRCSPFDRRGDGLIVGEGAGVFVLKRFDDARRDGDRILGILAGIGVSNDVEGGLLAPASEGQLRSMKSAYEQAGWQPDDVDFIECHATGTPLGDRIEFESLKRLWQNVRSEPGRCVLGAIKSTVGHLLTGAGAASLTKVLFALAEETLPPTANFEEPAPELELERSPFRILQQPEAWPRRSNRPRRAAISGFGFGGVNAHLLVEEAPIGISFIPHVERAEVAKPTLAQPLISIVTAEATIGSWTDAQLLQLDEPPPPLAPTRWWGIPPGERKGYFLDQVSLSEKYRIPPREVEEILPQQVLLLDVAGRAIERAALTDAERPRTGVFVGVSLDLNTTNFHLRWATLKSDPALVEFVGPPLTATRTMGALASIAASRIARAFRLGGPSFTVSSMETSGMTALHLAVEALRKHEIDVALVGAIDLIGDVRSALCRANDFPLTDSAIALVLRRGEQGLARIDQVTFSLEQPSSTSTIENLALNCGAATGLASVYRTVLALANYVLPIEGGARRWLGTPNTPSVVATTSTFAGEATVTLGRTKAQPRAKLNRPRREGFFVVEGESTNHLLAGLVDLKAWLEQRLDRPIEELTLEWLETQWRPTWQGRAVALLPRDTRELRALLARARSHLESHEDQPLQDRLFYAPRPLGRSPIAFVYPGSGNDFVGMGRDVALAWPELIDRQATENDDLSSQFLPHLFWQSPQQTLPIRDRLFAQVAVGTLLTDLLTGPLQVQPSAAIGYSLGESSMLFGLRAWRDRDEMLRRMHESTLFTSDLTGVRNAARAVWELPDEEPIDWRTVIFERDPDTIKRAMIGLKQVYLQIINTPNECVVGGHPAALLELSKRLDCAPLPVPETTTMHCEVVRPVAEAYRSLHDLPTSPPFGVRFYSAGLGHAFEVDSATAAEAILAQALDTLDFPTIVEAAYQDGARIFLEMGPGGSCSRMIRRILGDRPHLARSVCLPGADGLEPIWRTVAHLVAERIPVHVEGLYGEKSSHVAPSERRTTIPLGAAGFNVPVEEAIEPPPPLAPRIYPIPFPTTPLQQAVAVNSARIEAQASFLRLDASIQKTFADSVAFQGQLFEFILSGSFVSERPSVAFDRAKCLEFAIGKIANVLGPDFAEVDMFPTRVRLPDEPLMLVDRILSVEGEPRSLSRGRVVTEHDVLPGAWYLDNERIPTCLAVEAGQADLFLSGYLGIDFHTRGLAVYRLLDAVVTFHRGLPVAGDTIRYDIHVERFFRQDNTILFRFHFVGTVNGEPLLTMTDGCAGFFTAEELAGGKGVVQTELQLRPRPGVEPDDHPHLPRMEITEYDEQQIDALRRGDLGACFGEPFARLRLENPMRLPDGRLRLVRRVSRLEPRGGRFGIGRIVAEADVRPDDWFLTCHFVDDQVMPGTLMYECCLHTLRIFLFRLGWVGEHCEVVCEPVPGVASRLKCRGQVTASTRVVTYEVTLKERGYRPEPYAICDALMYADGKAIVEITDMSLRLTGLSRERIASLWHDVLTEKSDAHLRKEALFDRRHVLAFAVGKPSEAFGDRYLPFDDRFIARLPAPPYSFLDRVVAIDAVPWKMVAGGSVVAEYDVPQDEWYFESERSPVMPFSVFLEIPLQVCGWTSAYVGSALTSELPLHYRNLGGSAELLRPVTSSTGTLTSQVRLTKVASSGGMIIQDFDLEVRDAQGVIYRGSTTFGFFQGEALKQQVGIRDAKPFIPSSTERARGKSFDYPEGSPFPDAMLRMIDRVELYLPEGGPAGLGFVEGSKRVRPDEWFFAAHFYQDPVMPGSLGLEAMLQLLKVVAVDRWGADVRFEANLGKHQWIYRGQVVPTNRQVRVQATIKARDDERRKLVADGLLLVDGLVIYRMQDFTLTLVDRAPVG